MALKDFLGNTSEIAIVDFLAENLGEAYNQTEIAKGAGLSRPTVSQKISELAANELVEVAEEHGGFKTYQLKENDVVSALGGVVMAHSFEMAKEEETRVERAEEIRREAECEEEGPISHHIEPKAEIVYEEEFDETEPPKYAESSVKIV